MKKIVLFGIGQIGKKYIDECLAAGITDLKLVDSKELLWGSTYRGMEISNPADVIWNKYNRVVITTGDKYMIEILNNLLNIYEVPRKKIVFRRETMILSQKESYNLGNMCLEKPISEGIIVTGREFSNRLNKDTLNDLEKFYFEKSHHTINKWMHYFEAYNQFFSRYRGKDVKMLEIGVFKGGSLQMWKNYFQMSNNKVQIYGIDIDPSCKDLEEDGIKIFIGSQEDKAFLKELKKEIGKVDILIDDGGHTMNQQIVSFEELFDLVEDNGIYLCEDLHTSYMKEYGGEYRGKTFIEYSKSLIDYLHAQYSETNELIENKYSGCIKFVTYCDSMIVIEKKPKTTKSICVCI